MKRLENKTVFITGGLSGIGEACAIAAAKHGVLGLTQTAALEYAVQGIRINANWK